MLVDVQTLQVEADFVRQNLEADSELQQTDAAFFQVATIAGLSFWQHFEAALESECQIS